MLGIIFLLAAVALGQQQPIIYSGLPLQLWECTNSSSGQSFQLSPSGLLQLNPSWCAQSLLVPVPLMNVVLDTCTRATKDAVFWNVLHSSQGLQFSWKFGSSICIGYSLDVLGGKLTFVSCDDPHSYWFAGDSSTQFKSKNGFCMDAGSNFGPPCDVESNKPLPFCNTSLSWDDRAADLVSRIPVSMMPSLFDNDASAIGTVSLPAYQWWNEGLHGVASSPGVHYGGDVPATTSFPQVCTTAATFDTALFSAIGHVVGREGRAMNNVGRAGLTYWAPNINIYRDPRWGRGQETPGEDPLLTGMYAWHFVYNLQYDPALDPNRLQAAACCKHFAAYDLENWGGYSRHSFDAVVSPADEAETYFPAFQACIHKAGGAAAGIMCSYNAVNGTPSCANKEFLTTLARNTWGFDGYITSDCGAVTGIQDGLPAINWPGLHYTNSSVETVAVSLNAGMDQDCAIFNPSFIHRHLNASLAAHTVTLETVKESLQRQMRLFMRFGIFDPASHQPFKKITASDINTAASQQLAKQAALDGIVLIKYDASIMPLKTFGWDNVKTLAVLGPNRNATTTLQGNYQGIAPYLISPLAGLNSTLRQVNPTATVLTMDGVSISDNSAQDFDAACQMVMQADATVLVMGNDNTIEDEGKDRDSISLYGFQELFIQQMSRCKKVKTSPFAVVVLSGGSVDYSLILENDNVNALFWAGYPGQSGGEAIAEIIFGQYSPNGRLPHTVYPQSYADAVDMANMQMPASNPTTTGSFQPNSYPGRTHRFLSPPHLAVVPFGHGETYTSWKVSVLSQPQSINGASIDLLIKENNLLLPVVVGNVTLQIVNSGKIFSSKLSVLVKVQPIPSGKLVGGALAAFTKTAVAIQPGNSTTLILGISAAALAQFDPQLERLSVQRGAWHWWAIGLAANGTFNVI